MILCPVQTSLEQLWERTRIQGHRMRVHLKQNPWQGDAVFVLEVTNTDLRPLVEVTTKNLESAAAWILDHERPTSTT